MRKPRPIILVVFSIILFGLTSCSPDSQQRVLTAEVPLHLEKYLDNTRIEGSEVPGDLPVPVVWNFDEPQPDWKPIKSVSGQKEGVEPVQIGDALRLPLITKNRLPRNQRLLGGIFVKLPDWNLEDWAYVDVRVRTQDTMRAVSLAFNYTE